jgi:DUF1680 family protein
MAAACAGCLSFSVSAASVSPKPADVKIGGQLGRRLDACLEHNVKTTDGIYLTDVFKAQTEKHTWQTEFWGKWMHAAVPLYAYSSDAALKAGIDASLKNILSCQRADGYIGNYVDAAQVSGPWDVWGRKYTMLGLIHYYDATGDRAALTAACRVADHLMTQVGPGKKDLYKVGGYHGMASCSVLEPILWLHRRTQEAKYLDFAKYIVSQMEDPADSAKLVTKALAGVDVGSRFPHPSSWWVWENGMKAYEMLSCYQGLLEFYQTTGDRQYLDAAVATARNIMATEINAAGSGAAFECWYHGSARETEPAYHTMETCVTTTWLRFCQTLLRLTGDPLYADQIEKTLYNAFLAALSHDAATFSKYCPLEGMRGRGEDQCRMKTNCCIANGPRGFVALLETLLMADADAVLVNLYTDSRASVTLPGSDTRVTVEQKTDYPAGDTVTLTVTPAREAAFTLKLRIPAWSADTAVRVNGEPVSGVRPGAYLPLARTWKPGDTVTLTLDLRGRGRIKNNHLVLERGPLTLARDARFNDGNIHEVIGAIDVSKPVELTPVPSPDPDIWLAFTTKLRIGMNLETEEGKTPRPVHFCDFASAGDTWKEASLYRVWQRIPLNVTQQPYVPYNAE